MFTTSFENFPSRLADCNIHDACIKEVGTVLKQTNENGNNRPIAYFKKKLTEAQNKKKVIYLDCSAINGREILARLAHWKRIFGIFRS